MNGFMNEALCQIGMIWCGIYIIGATAYLAAGRLRARQRRVCREGISTGERRKNAAQKKRERRIEEDALRFINR